MNADELRQRLDGMIFSRVDLVTETGSTNANLLEAARLGWENAADIHGRVLVADYQHSGKGRGARKWAAPPGSALLTSVLMRPRGWDSARLGLLGVAMALSALEACEGLGASVGLKWPNDLITETAAIQGIGSSAPAGTGAPTAERKLGGVLAEMSPAGAEAADGQRARETAWRNDSAVVIGLGINLRWSEELERSVQAADHGHPERADDVRANAGRASTALPPISLDRLVGRRVDRNELLVHVLSGFDRRYRRLENPRGAPGLVDELRRRCVSIGRRVRLSTPSGMVAGTATGLSEEGHLIIDLPRVRPGQPRRKVIAVGDCIHLR